MEDPEAEFPALFSQHLSPGNEHGDSKEDDMDLDLYGDENDGADVKDILPPSSARGEVQFSSGTR